MELKDELHDMLNDINLQIVSLEARKEQLLQNKLIDESDVSSGYISNSFAEYLTMLSDQQKVVTNPRVVYQGEPGAYSEMAARNFFGENVRAIGLYQFEDTFLALKRGEADYAVLPVENSCTGAIRQVYDLLKKYPLFFVGETAVQVNHALMALPGTRQEDITTVYSHEQGLQQCASFLSSHPQWKQVAQADTAGSAKMVAELGDCHIAAICSTLAADIYGLEILQEKVNTESTNTTRFIVLSSRAELREKRDKICVSFADVNNSGVLQQIINVLNVYRIKLLHLEFRPISDRNWAYRYFLEFGGDLRKPDIDHAIRELFLICPDLRVLGNFQAGL